MRSKTVTHTYWLSPDCWRLRKWRILKCERVHSPQKFPASLRSVLLSGRSYNFNCLWPKFSNGFTQRVVRTLHPCPNTTVLPTSEWTAISRNRRRVCACFGNSIIGAFGSKYGKFPSGNIRLHTLNELSRCAGRTRCSSVTTGIPLTIGSQLCVVPFIRRFLIQPNARDTLSAMWSHFCSYEICNFKTGYHRGSGLMTYATTDNN